MDEPVPFDEDDLLFSFFYGTTKEAEITTTNTERKQAISCLDDQKVQRWRWWIGRRWIWNIQNENTNKLGVNSFSLLENQFK